MPEIALGLMAKYLEPGKVKTRLAKHIGDKGALEVYRQLLDHVVKAVNKLPPEKYFSVAFIAQPDKIDAFKNMYPGFRKFLLQVGNNLGERMHNAFKDLFDIEGIQKSILIGADIPQIAPDSINDAVKLLDSNDLVLGPAYDGGYYLIAFKQIYDELFGNVDWGTDIVLKQTIMIAGNLNLRVGQLNQMRDLDNMEDLRYFISKGIINMESLDSVKINAYDSDL